MTGVSTALLGSRSGVSISRATVRSFSANAIELAHTSSVFAPLDSFARRHIGPNDKEVTRMLKTLGLDSLNELVSKTIPESIHIRSPTKLGAPLTESETLMRIKEIASQNEIFRSYIGCGYYGIQ